MTGQVKISLCSDSIKAPETLVCQVEFVRSLLDSVTTAADGVPEVLPHGFVRDVECQRVQKRVNVDTETPIGYELLPPDGEIQREIQTDGGQVRHHVNNRQGPLEAHALRSRRLLDGARLAGSLQMQRGLLQRLSSLTLRAENSFP